MYICYPLKTVTSYKIKFTIVLARKNATVYSFNVHRYNKMSREVRELATKIKELDPKDPYRVEASAKLMEKL